MSPLLAIAAAARANAYAPYSGYRVGAAIEAADGRVFAGCNVENISYGMTMCAEQVAVARMVSEAAQEIRRVALITKDGGTPCGRCLQTMAEFISNPAETWVEIAKESGESREMRFSELLPSAFMTDNVARSNR